MSSTTWCRKSKLGLRLEEERAAQEAADQARARIGIGQQLEALNVEEFYEDELADDVEQREPEGGAV